MKRTRQWNRKSVQGRIDEDVLLTLRMLGFDIPVLIEELLSNVANFRRCPCCGREVRPMITGQNAKAYKNQEKKSEKD